MATLNVQQSNLTGLTPSYSAADVQGDEFVNSGKAVLHIKNGGVSQITVTVNSQTKCSFGFDHDVTVDVPAGEERIIGPFPKTRFDDANKKVQISYSDVTNVTIAVLEVA
ncbi:MAG: hypothetical protein HPY74_16910 [Firmicutes bacterium]|nr:hypothetical protein [Bacillota bacterium]